MEEFLGDGEIMKNSHRAGGGGDASCVDRRIAGAYGVLLELAVVICPRYPDIDQDLVLAGLFLHDIAKTVELSYTSGFDYTDQGRLIGHVVQGAIWVDQKAQLAAKKLGEPIRRIC